MKPPVNINLEELDHVTQEQIEKSPDGTFVVCLMAEDRSYYADNTHGHCEKCGIPIQYRPYIPDRVKKICVPCYSLARKNRPFETVSPPSKPKTITSQEMLDRILAHLTKEC